MSACALLSAVTTFTLVSAAGCGTDAQGVDDCRDIEQARCVAAKNCGIISNVAQCQDYYRDHCLHGLAVSPPNSAVVSSCVATIRAAGLCALEGPDTALSACSTTVSRSTTATSACQIVTNPETTSECSFLLPTVDAGTDSSSDTSGGSSSAGAGGAEGGGGGTAAEGGSAN